MAIIDNLISYWKMDEESGVTMTDAHGSNNGTITGADVNVTGKINTGYDFEAGDDDHVDVSGFPLNFSGFSFQAWVKPETIDILGRIASQGDPDFYLQIQSDNTLAFRHADVGDGTTVSLGHSLVAGNWHHVVVTWDGSNTDIYVNGVNRGGEAATGTWANQSSTLIFGERPSDGGNKFDGIMDEVGVWNKGLTQEEVTALYNSGNGLAYPFQESTQITDDGKARILIKDNQKTQTGTSRIQIDDTEEVYDGKARIEVQAQITYIGNANIEIADNQITKDSSGRLVIQDQKTQTGTSRIEIQSYIDKTGKAYISTSKDITKTSEARIQKTLDKTQTGEAFIEVRNQKTQTGVARIEIQNQKISYGKAYISLEQTYQKISDGTAFVNILDDFKPIINAINSTKPNFRSAETFN